MDVSTVVRLLNVATELTRAVTTAYQGVTLMADGDASEQELQAALLELQTANDVLYAETQRKLRGSS